MKLKKFAVAVAMLTLSGPALAQVAGSAHDMSQGGTSLAYNVDGTNTQVCVFCHTPHRSLTEAGKPLWNRGASTVTTYTMYSSDTLDGAIGTAPGGESLACLSCHDGTVAVNTLVNDPGTSDITETPVLMDAGYRVGSVTGTNNDISSDHPIGITYDPVADTGLNAIAAAIDGTNLELFGADQVECATCHEVHNDSTIVGSNIAFLRLPEGASAICTACHAK